MWNGLEILHSCGKRIETNSQRNFGSKADACTSKQVNIGTGEPFCPFILNWAVEYSGMFRHYWGLLSHNWPYSKLWVNPCVYHSAIFRTTHLELEASLKVCQTSKLIKHIRALAWSMQFIQAFSRIFRDMQRHWYIFIYTHNNRGKGKASSSFFENRKKCGGFGNKCPMSIDFMVSRRKTTKYFLVGPFFLVFLTKCLLKCPSSMKPLLPWNYWLHACTHTLFFLQIAPSLMSDSSLNASLSQ